MKKILIAGLILGSLGFTVATHIKPANSNIQPQLPGNTPVASAEGYLEVSSPSDNAVTIYAN